MPIFESMTDFNPKLVLPALPEDPGVYRYFDESNTHASSVIPVMFEVTQGPIPTPKPSPTNKPAPKPVDACAGQIRN